MLIQMSPFTGEDGAEPPKVMMLRVAPSAGFPEPVMFGEIPAYGFYIRHVKGLTMTDVEVSYMKDDARPPFMLEDVHGADFHRVKAQKMPETPFFVLKNVTDFHTNQCWPFPDLELEKVDQKSLL